MTSPPSPPKTKSGQIQIIFGPMFSGKTTELLRRIKRYTVANRKCLVIKYKGDTRYSVAHMSTHDQCDHRSDVRRIFEAKHPPGNSGKPAPPSGSVSWKRLQRAPRSSVLTRASSYPDLRLAHLRRILFP